MNRICRVLGSSLTVAILAASLVSAGCATHRVYDPYYADYHTWDSHETVYYTQWETENHKDHVDFNKRSGDEQKEYWTWRHSHMDNSNKDHDNH